MRKIILALGILMIGLGITRTAYAGSLNEYESEVIQAARGVFEYNGMQYQLDKSYVNLALEYMMSDDFDLTKAQRDKILQSMNSYVESGVKEGYLVPIPGQESAPMDNAEQTSQDTDNNSKGEKGVEEIEEEAKEEVKDETNDENIEESQNEPIEMNAPTASATEDTDSVEEESTITKTTQPTQPTQAADPKQNTDNQSADVIEKGAQGDFFGGLMEDAGSDNATIVKDTGFSLNTTVFVAALMGVSMFVGIIVTMKNNYFAHSDE